MGSVQTSVPRLLAAMVALVLGSAAAWQVARSDWTPAEDGGAATADRAPRDSWRTLVRPLDAGPFRALGKRAAAAGDDERAWRFYQIAARRDPRDPRVRVDLVDLARRRGDAATAALHLDALLRVAPALGAPMLVRVLDDAPGVAMRTAIVGRLASNPPWRALLPGALSAMRSVASAEALLAALGRHSPLRPTEAALRARLLERMGRPGEARRVWSEDLPTALKSLDGLLFDGGFESGEGPPPYGWRLRLDGAVAVDLATGGSPEGRRFLELGFDGAVLDGETITQQVALPAGTYLWEVEANLALAPDTRGFAWVLACRPGNLALARMALPTATRGWEHFWVKVTIPGSCPAQRVELVHDGRSAGERRPSGRAAFDAMRLRPVPP
jgi:hypothetical protein